MRVVGMGALLGFATCLPAIASATEGPPLACGAQVETVSLPTAGWAALPEAATFAAQACGAKRPLANEALVKARWAAPDACARTLAVLLACGWLAGYRTRRSTQ